jgi:hypothetical protein
MMDSSMTPTGSISEYHRGESGSRLDNVVTDVTYISTQRLQGADFDLAPSTTQVLIQRPSRTPVASRELGDSYDVNTLAASAAIEYSIKGRTGGFLCLYCEATLRKKSEYDAHILESEFGIRLVCIAY